MYFGTISYVKNLVDGHKQKKAMAFWLYAYNMEFNKEMNVKQYSHLWNIGESECDEWINEFIHEINNSVAIKRVRLDKHSRALK